jgi:hypothetical protein
VFWTEKKRWGQLTLTPISSWIDITKRNVVIGIITYSYMASNRFFEGDFVKRGERRHSLKIVSGADNIRWIPARTMRG